MARPRKDNCDYFPHMVGMLTDPKMRLAINKCGHIAYSVYCAVLEAVFSKGFFISTDDDAYVIIPADLHISQEDFDATMEVLLSRKLVENSLYRDGAVTSIGMVKQYFEIKNRTEIPEEWELIVKKLGLSLEELGLFSVETPQIKEKKRKEKERNKTQVNETEINQSSTSEVSPTAKCHRCGAFAGLNAYGKYECAKCNAVFGGGENA